MYLELNSLMLSVFQRLHKMAYNIFHVSPEVMEVSYRQDRIGYVATVQLFIRRLKIVKLHLRKHLRNFQFMSTIKTVEVGSPMLRCYFSIHFTV